MKKLFIFVISLFIGTSIVAGVMQLHEKVQAAYLPNQPQWVKITKNFSDFSTAGLTSTISIIDLPIGSIIHSTAIMPSTAFTGGAISAYTISVGALSNVDLLPASVVFTIPGRPFSSNAIVSGRATSTQGVTATAISTIGLLNTATAGSVDIYLLVSQLP